MKFISDAERNQFIEKNLPLVTSRVLKVNYGYYNDDLFQEGVIAMMRAVEKFDENRGTKFASYAVKHIDGAIRTYKNKDTLIRPLKKKTEDGWFQYKDIVSMDKVLSANDDGRKITVKDTIADDCNIEEDITAKEYMKKFNIYLNKREQYVLELLFENKTQTEIAELLGVSRALITKIKKCIQEKYEKCHKWSD